MEYTPTDWKNEGESNALPLSARNLNNIEDGIVKLYALYEKIQQSINTLKEESVKPCDYSRVIKTLTEQNEIWTATEDCWVAAEFEVRSAHNTMYITVDGKTFGCLSNVKNSSTQSSRFIYMPPCLFVKSGSSISFTHDGSSGTIKAYGCKKLS